MNTFRTASLLPFILSLAAAAGAQQAATALPEWRIPFHTEPGTDTAWAAGPGFKVAIGDGVSFYPRLGAARPDNLPLRWRTADITVGGESVLRGKRRAATPRTSGHRAELDLGGVVEAYDSGGEGVEQTFVLQRPALPLRGDLEVTGAVDGPLHAAERGLEHAPIVFCDDAGAPIVEYGAATAIDASGRRLELGTSFGDGRIRLRVPAAWLGEAEWPVTIDPLLAATSIVGATADAASPNVLRLQSVNRIYVVESRASAGGDWDVAMHAFDNVWGSIGTVYSDLSGTTSVRQTSIAWSQSEDRIVLALPVALGAGAYVRVYFHDVPSLVLNSGTIVNVPRPANTHDTEPAIGGSATRTCYLAFRRDSSPLPANTPQSRVVGVTVDAQTKTIGAPSDLHTLNGTNFDAERPKISSFSENSGWVVVWQEYNYDNVNDDWDVIAQRIKLDGTLGLGAVAGDQPAVSHKITPHVDGSGTRFLVAYLSRNNENTKTTADDGNNVYIKRLNWAATGSAQDAGAGGLTYFGAGTNNVRLGLTTRAVANDPLTGTLWGVAFQRIDTKTLFVARVGYDAHTAELTTLATSPATGEYHSPSLCYDQGSPGFLAVYTSTGTPLLNRTFGTRFVHGAARTWNAGPSCAGTIDAVNASGMPPFAGSEFFAFRLTGGRPNAATVLAVGAGMSAISLPSSVPGCLLMLDPTQTIVTLGAGVSQPSGSHNVPLPIPSAAYAPGIRWQFVGQYDALKLWSSDSVHTHIL